MAIGSFSASLSGLNANQQKLSVIGNNLANLNTVAFKASDVQFSDQFSLMSLHHHDDQHAQRPVQ